jgi:quercetin dioxygenase-like cupin family protein
MEGQAMQLADSKPTTKAPTTMFTGDVWFDVLAAPPTPARLRVNMVRFSPGARTAWHSHVLGQSLRVVEGIALVQSRGGPVVEVGPGQTIHCPPGEEHWHGAGPDTFMSHLAMWEIKDDDATATTWGEHVTDAEYRA